MTDPTTPRIHKLVDPETGQPVHLVYAIPPELLTGGAPGADDTGVNLHDLLQRLWRGRLWALGGAALGAVLGLVIALRKPDVYTAEVVALPPAEKAPSTNLAQLAGVAALAGINLPTGEGTPKDALMAILHSRTLHEQLIDEFHLTEHYQIPNSRDQTLKAFRADWSVKLPKGATITLGYTHTDPQQAAAVANQAAELLRDMFTQMQQSEANRERVFLEQRFKQSERDWQVAAEAMTAFMREHKAVQITAQTEATVAALGTLQGQLIAQQIELNAQRAVSSGENNPLVQLLVERVHGLEAEIARLQGSSTEGGLIGLGALPALGQEYLTLLRESKRQEALLNGLIAQVEAAKISEVREARTVTIIDPAFPPDIASGPNRASMCIIAAVLGMMAGCLLGLVSWAIQSRRIRTGPVVNA